MTSILLLRLDAPLMSFGAPIVDNRGVIQQLPALSMLTGMLGNALGYDHGEAEKLDRLQERIRYAVRRDRPGDVVRDFQTVDFTQGTDDLKVARTVGWTTRGRPEFRAGAANTLREKHIRYRDYLADALYVVALRLEPDDESPTLDEVADALDEPERPLFLGRKPCLPASPLVLARVDADSLLESLRRQPALRRTTRDRPESQRMTVWWEEGDEIVDDSLSTVEVVTDERDWKTQLHGGQRTLRRAEIEIEEVKA